MLRRQLLLIVTVCAIGTSTIGCQSYRSAARSVRQPEYHALSRAVTQSHYQDATAAATTSAATAATSPVVPELEGPHTLEEYVDFGLSQNPQIQAARMRVEAAAAKVPQAASLQDPILSLVVQPAPVQTAAGEQEFSLSASQKVPWRGKLATSAAIARRALDAARAELHAVELHTIEKIQHAYYDLQFVEQALEITEQDKQQLELIARIVERRYAVAADVNQQDVLQVDLEISKVDSEILRYRQQLESRQASLASLLHVSPETQLRTSPTTGSNQFPDDIEQLYQQAIAARPELQVPLANIAKNRCAAERARLDYFPDITWGMTWIETSSGGISPVSNGRDALLLSAGVNLPVYKKRLAAAVREAEATALSNARDYDSLKDETMRQIKDLFSQVESQQALLQLFTEDILPKAQQTFEQSIDSYQVGEVGFLQVIDNWRQLLRLEIGEKRLESQLQQRLASLARVVGHDMLLSPSPQTPGQVVITEEEKP